MQPIAIDQPWAQGVDRLMLALQTSSAGLASPEAARRLKLWGLNTLDDEREPTAWLLLLRQASSPLVLILVFGASVSLALGEWVNALIILAMVLASALLTFGQEWRASRVVAALGHRLALKAQVARDGRSLIRLSSHLVPGDVMLLGAGQLVAADGIVIEARDFLVSQASLTGESHPVDKWPGILPADTALAARSNSVYLGTTVRSGSARVLVVNTGKNTVFGQIGQRLVSAPPPTEFARGVRQFEQLLLRTMLTVVVLVVAVNYWLGRPALDSMMFAVALAVGLTPELLPAIVSITMSRGARNLAHRGVLVRRLQAIEDLGGMQVLCTDKTGTITEDQIKLHACLGLDGLPSASVLRLSVLNASLQGGVANPLDEAIVRAAQDLQAVQGDVSKVDEIPYDFQRKRLTVVVRERAGGDPLLITKGSYDTVLAVCEGGVALARHHQAWFEQSSEQGYRVLALATRSLARDRHYSAADEQAMNLQGFILFGDQLKPGMAAQLNALKKLGIETKIVSGDNRYICARVAAQIGLNPQALLNGRALSELGDDALGALAVRTDVFAEVDPQQKERIVRALQRRGQAVGFMGDGINDAPALHAADVGISAEHAVDIARQAADIVMLKRHLDVLHDGVIVGRTTFANTLKYIGITTSANFGNMLSMAIATPLLPWLPLLAKQILLNNLISDLPSLMISTDRVDAQELRSAQRWDAPRVRRFMLGFGLISTVFDLLAFAVLLWAFEVGEALFQTSWFVLSLLTELLVLLVLRTRQPFWRSRCSPWLGAATLGAAILALALPYASPINSSLGFVPLPVPVLGMCLLLVVAYAITTEVCKRWIWRL